MSVKNDIKQTYKDAIKKISNATVLPYIEHDIRIAISKSDSNEYFVVPNTETETTIRVTRDNGSINCNVFKKRFNFRWVGKDYKLKKLS